MSSLSLPDSILPLLPWLAIAAVVVLVGWLALRRLQGGGEESGPPNVLIPPPGPGEGVWGRLASAGEALVGAGRPILTGFIVLVLAGVAVFLYRTATAGSWSPEYVEVQATPGVSSRPGPSGPGPAEAGVPADSVAREELVLWSGTGQTGALGRMLGQSLAVVLLNAEGRPIPDREIRFEVAPGGGTVDPETVTTSASGLAVTRWRLGRDSTALRVTAYSVDRPGLSVQFTATGVPSSEVAASPQGASPQRSGSGVPAASDTGAAEAAGDTSAADTSAGSGSGGRAVATPARARPWAAGGVHTCRRNTAGAISCWGGSRSDQWALDGVIWGVAAGVFHVCGITEASTIGCWPVGGSGGQAIVGEHSLPDGARPVELAIGSEHVCARSDRGRVYCWGSNGRGQLGTPGGSRTDPAVVTGLSGVVQIASGWFHTCALTRSGEAYCWGANDAGQLGLGATEDRPRPSAVLQPEPFSDLTAGSSHTCGLTVGGDPWCWGDNEYGQLGIRAVARATRPTAVETELNFESIVAGGVHNCGVTGSGNAWCWGRNVFGQLGDGTTENSASPVPVGGGYSFARLGGGGAHTCGESVNGSLYCWGNNIQGQLGDGTRDNRTGPVHARGGP